MQQLGVASSDGYKVGSVTGTLPVPQMSSIGSTRHGTGDRLAFTRHGLIRRYAKVVGHGLNAVEVRYVLF